MQSSLPILNKISQISNNKFGNKLFIKIVGVSMFLSRMQKIGIFLPLPESIVYSLLLVELGLYVLLHARHPLSEGQMTCKNKIYKHF